MPFSCLAKELDQRNRQGLLRRRHVLETAQGARIQIGGRAYLGFCSNDYLGLAAHPRLVEAVRQGVASLGVGAGASHLVSGHFITHHQAEEALAGFVGKPRALLFSSGYMANQGVITALLGRGDAVFADKLNHASLNEAALLSRARLLRYPHLDLDSLARLLASSRARRKLVVSDAVFSMDGDIAFIPELLALCERYDAWLLLDDAHGIGVLGEEGRGTLSHFGVDSPRLIYMATLGKAVGVFGAFVAGDARVVEYLAQSARSYIYTTALPPSLAGAVTVSLHILQEEGWRRERLRELIERLRAGVQQTRWRLLPSVTPIQLLWAGSNETALALAGGLREKGLWIPAIRPPTVPRGQARLRITLSAAHRPADVDCLVDALRALQ